MPGKPRNKRRHDKAEKWDSLLSKVQHTAAVQDPQGGPMVSNILDSPADSCVSQPGDASQELQKPAASPDLVTTDAQPAPASKAARSMNSKPDKMTLKTQSTSDTVESVDCTNTRTTAVLTEQKHSIPVAERLGRKFYDVSGEDLAKALLGQKIVRMVDGVRLCAKIVETEAYLGAADKAAHSYKRQTDRNKAMFMQPGTAYVYNIYGMYCCLNISSQGEGCAVLIRSVEPLEGVDKMAELRQGKKKSSTPSKGSLKVRDLGNGPSKLCQSLNITKPALNQRDLVTDTETWLEQADEVVSSAHTVVSERVNIAYAEEWTHKPLRFYILGNPCISVRDKKAEKEMQSRNSQYFS